MLICLNLFSGCTDGKGNNISDTGLGNDADVDIDGEKRRYQDIVFNFNDLENADGIVVFSVEFKK